MQITEKELIEIINEEIKDMIENDDVDEGVLDRMKASAAGLGSGLKSSVAGAFGQDTTDIDATQKLKKAASLMKSYDKQLLKLAQSLKMDAAKMGIEDQTAKVQQAITQTRAQVRGIARDAPTSARQQRQDQTRDQRMMQQRQQQQQGQQQQQAAPTQQQQQAAPTQQQQAAPQTRPAQQQQQMSNAGVPDSQNPVTQLQRGQSAIPEPGQFSAPEDPNQTVARQKIKNATAAAPKGVKSAGPKPTRQLSQDPRNVARREKRASTKAAAQKAQAQKDARNARRRANYATKKKSRSKLRRVKEAVPSVNTAGAQLENKTKKGETLNEQLQEISRRWGFDK